MGVILFEMLAGRCPIEGPSTPVVLAQVIEGRVPRIESFCALDADLASIIHGALTANREARLPSIDAMLSLLLLYAESRIRDGGTIAQRHRISLEHRAPLGVAEATVVVPAADAIKVLPAEAIELDDDAVPPTTPPALLPAEVPLPAMQPPVAKHATSRAPPTHAPHLTTPSPP